MMGIQGVVLRSPVFAYLVLVLCFCSPAWAEKRTALVIGNAAYRNATALSNPRNDADDVASALNRAGFETIVGFDLDKAGMDGAAIRFARAARDADVAVFYYSGHAMQYAGINYLIPVDARLTDEADLRLMLRVDDVVADLQQAKNLRILVLDSCRDNPLAEDLKRSIGLSRGAGIRRGLARIDTPQGMIVAYATQAGRTADDGKGRNSPYTAAFLKNIGTTEEIGTVFRRISSDVYEATGRAQLPELSLSLIGEFYLNGQPSAFPASSPEVAALQKQLQEMKEQLNKKEKPGITVVTAAAGPSATIEPADGPLPDDIPINTRVLSQIEAHPFFANAPPILTASFAQSSNLVGRGSVNGTATTSELTGDSVGRQLRKHVIRFDGTTYGATMHSACSPACRTDSRTVSISAANGLISLGSKSAVTMRIPRSKPTQALSTVTLIDVSDFAGRAYPVEVGNRFSYNETFETRSPGFSDEYVNRNSCEITKKYQAKSFHPELTGAAYLSICEVQTAYKMTVAASSRFQSRSVFFENLGIWTTADPMFPKERIMQGDLYGDARDWKYTGSDTLKTFSMAH